MTTLTRRSLLAGAASAATLGIIGSRAEASPPMVSGAAPNPTFTALFNGYSDSGVGWTGADSTYSTPLPRGRELWMFSDTFLGPVNPDGGRPRDTPFLNNSFILQRDGALSTIDGRGKGIANPTDPTHWYWLGAGLAVDGLHHQMLIEFARTGTGQWDFAWVGTSLARYPLDRLDRPIDIRPLPSGAGITWASWLQQLGPFLYVYGVEDLGASKYLHVARMAGRTPLGRWEYWTGTGWSTVESDSVRVLEGVSNEYSVTPWRGRYLLVTQDTTELFSTKIVAYLADRPTGPFTGKTVLYRTPETGALGSYGNPNVFTYNPHVHPELSTPRRLLVTYNVNSLNPDDLYADVSIYRPRFIDVVLSH